MKILKPIENCYWALPHTLLAGEYPGVLRDEASETMKIDALIQAGITRFINLTTESDGLRHMNPR